jgi:hypothetical protein
MSKLFYSLFLFLINSEVYGMFSQGHTPLLRPLSPDFFSSEQSLSTKKPKQESLITPLNPKAPSFIPSGTKAEKESYRFPMTETEDRGLGLGHDKNEDTLLFPISTPHEDDGKDQDFQEFFQPLFPELGGEEPRLREIQLGEPQLREAQLEEKKVELSMERLALDVVSFVFNTKEDSKREDNGEREGNGEREDDGEREGNGEREDDGEREDEKEDAQFFLELYVRGTMDMRKSPKAKKMESPTGGTNAGRSKDKEGSRSKDKEGSRSKDKEGSRLKDFKGNDLITGLLTMKLETLEDIEEAISSLSELVWSDKDFNFETLVCMVKRLSDKMMELRKRPESFAFSDEDVIDLLVQSPFFLAKWEIKVLQYFFLREDPHFQKVAKYRAQKLLEVTPTLFSQILFSLNVLKYYPSEDFLKFYEGFMKQLAPKASLKELYEMLQFLVTFNITDNDNKRETSKGL